MVDSTSKNGCVRRSNDNFFKYIIRSSASSWSSLSECTAIASPTPDYRILEVMFSALAPPRKQENLIGNEKSSNL